jgi:hypothetical protein
MLKEIRVPVAITGYSPEMSGIEFFESVAYAICYVANVNGVAVGSDCFFIGLR